MWILISLIAMLLGLMILRFLKQFRSHKNYPPGPLRLPIVGSIWRLLIDLSQDSFLQLAKQYGNVYTIWAGNLPVVVFSGFEAVKEAAVKHSEYFDERPQAPFFDGATNGNGIGLANGQSWKKHRKFGLGTMRKLGLGKKGMEHQIDHEAHQLAEAFTEEKGQPFDPAVPITNSVTNVICALIFGQRFSIKDEEFLKLRDALCVFLQFTASIFHFLYDRIPWLMKRLPGPHQKAIAAREFIASFIKKEIEKHKAYGRLHEPQDLTDYYLLHLEKNKRDPASTYNEENMLQNILELFGAGTETMATTIYWGLLLMANYPDIQAKVQKEIDEVFGSCQSFSYQDRKKVPYTNAVIHEIQRFRYILLFGIPRQCSKDANVFGFFIPKGATVVIDFRSALLDLKKWASPEEFNPNHFLDEDGHFVENEAFLPFGAGARVCLGELLARIELFIIFTRLLRIFTFQPPEGVKKISENCLVRLTTPPAPYKICAVPCNNGS